MNGDPQEPGDHPRGAELGEVVVPQKPPRVGWDAYFMEIARVVARRGTCPRRRVGSIAVDGHRILCTGYNGSPSGDDHCDDVGCLMEDGHCIRSIHAEVNVIGQAARHGVRIAGATVYVTASPCWACFKALASAGVKRVGFGEFYPEKRIFEAAPRFGIELVNLS